MLGYDLVNFRTCNVLTVGPDRNPPAVLGVVIGFPFAVIGFSPTMISTTPPG